MNERIYIVAHTQNQLDTFLYRHRIPRKNVRRVMRAEDVLGVRPELPLVLLPGWIQTRESDEIWHAWKHRGGEVLEIREPQVLGLEPLCPHDTNGDGDCHLCHRKGGCRWPAEPPALKFPA